MIAPTKPYFQCQGRFSPARQKLLERYAKVDRFVDGRLLATFQSEADWRAYVEAKVIDKEIGLT